MISNDETTTKNTISSSISYDSNAHLNYLSKSIDENKDEANDNLNRLESKMKIKKFSIKPEETSLGRLENTELKNLTKNEKLASKLGISKDPSNLGTNNVNMKLHHLETDVSVNA